MESINSFIDQHGIEDVISAIKVGILAMNLARQEVSKRRNIEEYDSDPDFTSVSPDKSDLTATGPATAASSTNIIPRLPQSHPSCIIGQIGEISVEQILRKHFGQVEFSNSKSMSGDITLFVDYRKILVEVKNYSRLVPATEVDKFHRDIKATNAAAGLFISLKSSIAKIEPKFHLEYAGVDTPIPCIYMSIFSEDMIVAAVTILAQLVGALEYINHIETDTNKIIEKFLNFEQSVTSLSKIRTEMMSNLQLVTTSAITTSTNIAIVQTKLQEQLTNIRKELSIADVYIEQLPAILLSHERYKTYPQPIRTIVDSVVQAINESLLAQKINGSRWSISGLKCINKDTGFYINLAIRPAAIYVGIPASRVTIADMIFIRGIYPKYVVIDESYTIILNGDTLNCIIDLIKIGKYTPLLMSNEHVVSDSVTSPLITPTITPSIISADNTSPSITPTENTSPPITPTITPTITHTITPTSTDVTSAPAIVTTRILPPLKSRRSKI
jgi:hypothetical protein